MRRVCCVWILCLLLILGNARVWAADMTGNHRNRETLLSEPSTKHTDVTETVALKDKEASDTGTVERETTSDSVQEQNQESNAYQRLSGETASDSVQEQNEESSAYQQSPGETTSNPTQEQNQESTPSLEKDSEDQTSEDTGDSNLPKNLVSLKIDNQNIYKGMTRAYKNGYQPLVEKDKVTIVVPLLCDGKVKGDCLTASVELGNTDNSPFVYRTYEKNFQLKAEPINGTKKKQEVFLISFVLDLDKKRLNGIYPVTIQVKGWDESENEISQAFTGYVIITDGMDPGESFGDMGGGYIGGGEETPTSAPIVLVEKTTIQANSVKAGEDFEAVVTLRNTSTQKYVRNMVITVQVPSPEFELKNDSNTIFVDKLEPEDTTDITLRFHADKSIADGNYPMELTMSYDDPKANTYSSSGVFMVTVEQPLTVELTMPPIPKEMIVDDTIPLSFQVMNLGRSTVYNVRIDITSNGLSQTRTAFIGNMESGTEGEGQLNLIVTTMEGEQAYGKTTGTATLSYEDALGNAQTQEFIFETEIKKKQDASQNQQVKEYERASQWWVSILILTGLIALVGCSAGAYYLGRNHTWRQR